MEFGRALRAFSVTKHQAKLLSYEGGGGPGANSYQTGVCGLICQLKDP